MALYGPNGQVLAMKIAAVMISEQELDLTDLGKRSEISKIAGKFESSLLYYCITLIKVVHVIAAPDKMKILCVKCLKEADTVSDRK